MGKFKKNSKNLLINGLLIISLIFNKEILSERKYQNRRIRATSSTPGRALKSQATTNIYPEAKPTVPPELSAAEQYKTAAKNIRASEYPVLSVIKDRWSPRAMSGERINNNELYTLFEAAKWAPSSYNDQPWKFIYAQKDSQYWETFLELLVPFNQIWAKNSGALIVAISKKTYEKSGKISPFHSFDTGAACENIALQAFAMGLVVHAIGGFDYDKARKELGIPEDYSIEVILAIGKPGAVSSLPDYMQKTDIPTIRKSLDKFVSEGKFNFSF